MPDIDTNISSSFGGPIQGVAAADSAPSAPVTPSASDSSTIEKSELAGSLLVAAAGIPQLSPPSASPQASTGIALSGLEGNQKFILKFLDSIADQANEIKQEILDKWSKNIEEIQEQVKQMLNSPTYQYNREIQIKGDTASSLVNSVQQLDQWNRSSNALESLTIPMMAFAVIGGSLALTVTEVSASSATPLSGSLQIVERLGPLFPQLTVENVVPLINLMVAAPLYFNSWKDALGQVSQKEGRSGLSVVQNFAKDVIKMVSDPAFILAVFVNRMDGAEQMSDQQKQEMVCFIKLILTSVALSLLYSVEVGKTHSGKYGGMEAQEFRDILNGKIPVPYSGKGAEGTMGSTLIAQARAQLSLLSPERRGAAVEAILEYVGNPNGLEKMLDPSKVFQDVLAFTTSSPKGKHLENQPV